MDPVKNLIPYYHRNKTFTLRSGTRFWFHLLGFLDVLLYTPHEGSDETLRREDPLFCLRVVCHRGLTRQCVGLDVLRFRPISDPKVKMGKKTRTIGLVWGSISWRSEYKQNFYGWSRWQKEPWSSQTNFSIPPRWILWLTTLYHWHHNSVRPERDEKRKKYTGVFKESVSPVESVFLQGIHNICNFSRARWVCPAEHQSTLQNETTTKIRVTFKILRRSQ